MITKENTLGRITQGNSGGDVVLVHLAHNNVTPFVTGIVPTHEDDPIEWYWGHYHADIISAAAEFQHRAGKD